MQAAGPVLLVEDTPSLSLVYETVLKKAGYQAARRTVAKYRRELGIPSSYRRRRY